MSTFGNALWIILGGAIISALYLLGGLLLCLTIIGIPFGIQCMKLSILSLLPFGREVHPVKAPMGALSILMNVLWILILGIEIALIHLLLSALFAITIIGLPFAKQHLKLVSLSLLPFGNTTSDWAQARA
ncbi:MAG: YccF domain-containing protein [Opitutales bacterium]